MNFVVQAPLVMQLQATGTASAAAQAVCLQAWHTVSSHSKPNHDATWMFQHIQRLMIKRLNGLLNAEQHTQVLLHGNETTLDLIGLQEMVNDAERARLALHDKRVVDYVVMELQSAIFNYQRPGSGQARVLQVLVFLQSVTAYECVNTYYLQGNKCFAMCINALLAQQLTMMHIEVLLSVLSNLCYSCYPSLIDHCSVFLKYGVTQSTFQATQLYTLHLFKHQGFIERLRQLEDADMRCVIERVLVACEEEVVGVTCRAVANTARLLAEGRLCDRLGAVANELVRLLMRYCDGCADVGGRDAFMAQVILPTSTNTVALALDTLERNGTLSRCWDYRAPLALLEKIDPCSVPRPFDQRSIVRLAAIVARARAAGRNSLADATVSTATILVSAGLDDPLNILGALL